MDLKDFNCSVVNTCTKSYRKREVPHSYVGYFNVKHHTGGEDGNISALLDLFTNIL